MRANMQPCLFLWLLPAFWPVQVSASNFGQCRAVPAEIIAALEASFDPVGRMVGAAYFYADAAKALGHKPRIL